MIIHVATAGETAAAIAEQYEVSEERLIYDNQLAEQNSLVTGQAVLVLNPEITHVVQAGDTLASIAEQFGISQNQLYRNNPYLLQQAVIQPGETMVIRYDDELLDNMQVMGYAYTFIETALLREQLLYLSELMVFSYGFTVEGELIPPPNEDLLINQALEFGVEPILVLTPLTEQGNFNSNLISAVLSNDAVQQTLIDNLLETVETKQYGGVDVDFEYIPADNRDNYTAFVGKLRTAMNAQGFQVSVALAPKIAADQEGLLYEGMDYANLGKNADFVFLMTYEWGYTYGPPMAVAPLNQVERVLDYAITEITPDQIYLGIPNYGYDWPLPYQRGVTKATTIGNVEAVQIAAQYGAVIEWDDTAKSPFFYYWKDEIQHEVWFEDVRSIREKVRLASSRGCYGIGYWNLMRPFRANWLLINGLLFAEA